MLTKMCKNVQRFSKSAPNCPFRGKRNSKTNFLCIALLHIYPCLLSFDVLLEQVHRPNAHFRQYLSRISSLYRQTSLNSVRQKGLLAVSNLDMNH